MRFFCIVFFLTFIFSIQSQELVEFTMGPGYQYDIYYSLEDGFSAYPERDNWEIAFSTGYNPNIRINSGTGVTLFEVSNDIDNWSEVTSLPANAIQLRNSNLDWQLGAFTVNEDGDFDSDWLDYNYNSDIIFQSGSKIYIINYGQESKKIKVNSFYGGTFNLTVANLDGSGEQTLNVNTLDYSDKKFVFYSLTNNEIIDREPNSEDWDIVFTKYEVDLYKETNKGEMFYNVTGALTNNNLTAQYDGFLDVNPLFSSLYPSVDISVIGWDWKQYGGGGYTIVPNRSYFILNQDETRLYKIVFSTFSGGGSGNCSFIIEELVYNPSNLHMFDNNDFLVYPNPNNGYFKINHIDENTVCTIIDSNGRHITTETLNNSNTYFDLRDKPKGVYFISLVSDNFHITKKIILD